MSRCDQEMCPMWDGHGCPCATFDLDRDDLPPVPRFHLTVEILGNTLDEVDHELGVVARSFWAIDVHHPVDREPRNAFEIYGGRSTRRLEERNADMTPERYDAELEAWSAARKAARRGERP